MHITKLELTNWKNFSRVSVGLSPRVFIVGNNGTGKSNLLDALRFLRDIANPKGGGLQAALEKRGGIKKVRSLSARKISYVGVCLEIIDDSDVANPVKWKYEIFIDQEKHGKHRPKIKLERVCKNDDEILKRPKNDNDEDSDQLTQTALEQANFNKGFRDIKNFLESFKYLHIVPQLIRYSGDIQGNVLSDDPFGQDLMNAIAASKWQKTRLKKIEKVLQKIKPAFAGDEIGLEFERDAATGKPHLKFKHPSWRANNSWQTESAFSDGELRLIGLLWTLLESNPVIMLEEPELSFNERIIEELPSLFSDTMESKKKRKGEQQIILTTHSYALLSDEDISADEILLLSVEGDKTVVQRASENKGINIDMEAGLSAAKSVLRYAQSENINIGSLVK